LIVVLRYYVSKTRHIPKTCTILVQQPGMASSLASAQPVGAYVRMSIRCRSSAVAWLYAILIIFMLDVARGAGGQTGRGREFDVMHL